MQEGADTHTCPGYSGRSRMQEPSFNHSRPRLGRFCGTLSPSRREIRSTRLVQTPIVDGLLGRGQLKSGGGAVTAL